MFMAQQERTIVSAMNPFRYEDSYTEIFLTVWFEELDGPVDFSASPFDCERHGKELWIRAMAGEFGPIDVREDQSPVKLLLENQFKQRKESEQKLLTFDLSESKGVGA